MSGIGERRRYLSSGYGQTYSSLVVEDAKSVDSENLLRSWGVVCASGFRQSQIDEILGIEGS